MSGDEFEEDLPDPCREAVERIRSHVTRPGRVVFVDRDNCDGWISTDVSVELTE